MRGHGSMIQVVVSLNSGWGSEILPPEPKSQINQCDQGRNFNQWANHADKSLSAINTKYADGNSYSQFKVVSRGSKSNCRTLRIICANFLASDKANNKHQRKVNHQWNSNAQYVERKLEDHFPFKAEHDDNGEQQSNQPIPTCRSRNLSFDCMGLEFNGMENIEQRCCDLKAPLVVNLGLFLRSV